MSIPTGQLLSGNDLQQWGMDKFDVRRLNFLELLRLKCDNKPARFANITDMDPSYVTRMKYAQTKKGHKKIGDETLELIQDKFNIAPGLMDTVDGIRDLFDPKQAALGLPQPKSPVKTKLILPEGDEYDFQVSKLYKELSPDMREAVLSLIQSIHSESSTTGTTSKPFPAIKPKKVKA